jgi:ketosteroid isomerase-like protein
MSTPSPREVFLRLVHGVCAQEYHALPELYAERTDVRHPMWPGGTPPLTSRDDLRRHFDAAAAGNDAAALRFQPANIVVHETQDAEVIVTEFEYRANMHATGEPFAIPCVFVMRVRDGQIVESRDYVDHLASARARGRLDQLISAIRSPETS